MNKGRNIALLLGAMLCVSILTFLVRMNTGNWQGVYDGVRYVKGDTLEEKTDYEFFFVERDKLKGQLEYLGDEYYLTIDEYEYDYRIRGTNRKDAKVEAYGKYEILEGEPFDLISKKVLVNMIFGKPALLTIPKAIVVFLLVILGALIILKAEELWHFLGRKDKSNIPTWKDLTIYKVIGGSICGLALVLLLVFLIV